ncbi:MAG: hypothetical protein C0592_14385 [Marinilabiliales bacterium]|nr:MAG: hypothetical protein C0592_14385 [Marinilabiliales bacterium]
MLTMIIVYAIIMILLYIVPIWLVFSKAGKPGVAAIVPIWNIIVMLEVAKKPIWWILLIMFVPIANLIMLIMTFNGISKNFGKSEGFTVGMILLPFIFWPILGYGSAKYNPPADPAPAA